MTKQTTTQIFALVAELSSPSDMSSPSAVHLITLSMTTPSVIRIPGAQYAPEVNSQGETYESSGSAVTFAWQSHKYLSLVFSCPGSREIAMKTYHPIAQTTPPM
jgi:hypothetical protein